MSEVETLAEVAKHFQVKPHTVGAWKKAGCPALQHPPYDLEAAKEWRAYKPHGAKTDGLPDEDKSGLARRKLEAQIRKHEMEAELRAFQLAVKRHELIDARDVQEIVSKQSQGFRRELLALPRALAHLLVGIPTPELVEAKLAEEMRKSLTRLSLKYLEDSKEGD
jgi:hypothetical protein